MLTRSCCPEAPCTPCQRCHQEHEFWFPRAPPQDQSCFVLHLCWTSASRTTGPAGQHKMLRVSAAPPAASPASQCCLGALKLLVRPLRNDREAMPDFESPIVVLVCLLPHIRKGQKAKVNLRAFLSICMTNKYHKCSSGHVSLPASDTGVQGLASASCTLVLLPEATPRADRSRQKLKMLICPGEKCAVYGPHRFCHFGTCGRRHTCACKSDFNVCIMGIQFSDHA